jgi:UDPglucose 6-dehydrogenase
MRVGIIGNGVVGGATRRFIQRGGGHELIVYDPPQGLSPDLSGLDVAIISVPVPTKEFKLDIKILMEVLRLLEASPPAITIIRSTILPGTTRSLSRAFKAQEIVHIPEFLTERTANQDMISQRKVMLGIDPTKEWSDAKRNSLLATIGDVFKGKIIELTTWETAEFIKYTHNSFGALKVTFFNGIKDLTDRYNVNYEDVVNGVTSVTPFFTNHHTKVPGPDGKGGFGGACFPKDVAAFMGFAGDRPIQALLMAMWSLNKVFRGSEPWN